MPTSFHYPGPAWPICQAAALTAVPTAATPVFRSFTILQGAAHPVLWASLMMQARVRNAIPPCI